uniref:Uncharacterized protein n=1 Tax=Pristionchus pacificus TaxID=54126 RepID=A0A2A6B327_PRIPA|eukprot:PDM60263.1 hypothetical protein PRIPAC_54088 [Pristionchus pacificus]
MLVVVGEEVVGAVEVVVAAGVVVVNTLVVVVKGIVVVRVGVLVDVVDSVATVLVDAVAVIGADVVEIIVVTDCVEVGEAMGPTGDEIGALVDVLVLVPLVVVVTIVGASEYSALVTFDDKDGTVLLPVVEVISAGEVSVGLGGLVSDTVEGEVIEPVDVSVDVVVGVEDTGGVVPVD